MFDRLAHIARAIFTRKVRASLYGSAIAADAALVASGDLPAWTALVAGPLLLALLNLTPADIDDTAPNQD